MRLGWRVLTVCTKRGHELWNYGPHSWAVYHIERDAVIINGKFDPVFEKWFALTG